jgi:hypothetical protein
VSYRYLRFGELFRKCLYVSRRVNAVALETEALPSIDEKKPLEWVVFCLLAFG